MSSPAVFPSGRKDIMPPPMMPGMVHRAIHAQQRDVRRMPKPTRRVKKMLTIPEEVLRSAALGELKSKDRIRVAE